MVGRATSYPSGQGNQKDQVDKHVKTLSSHMLLMGEKTSAAVVKNSVMGFLKIK